MSNIVLSICIPTYKHPKLLSKNLKIMISCQSKNFEIVIFHDGPPDGSQEVVDEINDPRINYYRIDKNFGFPFSILKLVEKAKGDFVAFSSDEDYINPEIIPWIIKTIKQHNNLTQILGTINHDDSIPKKTYWKSPYAKKILNQGHESLTQLLFRYTHMSGILLKKQSLNIKQAKKYIEGAYGLYMHLVLQAQAMNAGYTLCTSKVIAYVGSIQSSVSHHKTHEEHMYWHPLSRFYQLKEKIKLIYDITSDIHTQKILLNIVRGHASTILKMGLYNTPKVFFKILLGLLKIKICIYSLDFWINFIKNLFFKIRIMKKKTPGNKLSINAWKTTKK